MPRPTPRSACDPGLPRRPAAAPRTPPTHPGLLAVLGLWGCGSTERPAKDPAQDRAPQGERASAIVGPQGGTLRLTRGEAKGATIVIPPGALARPVTITMQPTSLPNDLPKHLRIAGPLIDFGPDGLTFLKPVTVTLPAGRRANVAYQRTSRGQWTQVHNAHRTTDGRMVSTLTHFSLDGSFEALLTGHCANFVPPAPATMPSPEWSALDQYPEWVPGGDTEDDTAPEIELKEKESVGLQQSSPPDLLNRTLAQISARVTLERTTAPPPTQIVQRIEHPAGTTLVYPEVGVILPGYRREGHWVYALYPIASATLVKNYNYPNQRASNLLLTVAHPLKQADDAYRNSIMDGKGTDGKGTTKGPPRRFAVLFGNMPLSTHKDMFPIGGLNKSIKKNIALPFMDVPILDTDPAFMLPPYAPSATRQEKPAPQVVPRFHRAFSFVAKDAVEPSPPERADWAPGGYWDTSPTITNLKEWPNPLDPQGNESHGQLLTIDLAFIVLNDWPRDDPTDQPATNVNVDNTDGAHPREQYPAGWFDPRPAYHPPMVTALAGMELPHEQADFDALAAWNTHVLNDPIHNPNNLDFGCGDSAGYGFTAPNTPLRPPKYTGANQHTRGTLQPGEEQRTAEVDVFGPTSLLRFGPALPQHSEEDEWIAMSNSIFHTFDMGNPVIDTINGREMPLGFCTYGETTPYNDTTLYLARFLKIHGSAARALIDTGLEEARSMRTRRILETGVLWP